jgi:PII-like signaling protein
MELSGTSILLRVFTGEADRIGHQPVYERIIKAARDKNIAGATVLRGIMGFGASSVIHTARLIEISGDLPVVIEIVDTESKIDEFIPVIQQIFEQSKKGGLITTEKVNVLLYRPDK